MQLHFAKIIDDKTAILDEEETMHITKSLRKKIGDEVNLMDGMGFFYLAKIKEIRKKEIILAIIRKSAVSLPWNFNLHMAVAPTKNIERIEWLLEKAVEIGLNTFTPIYCRHSERRNIRIDRLEKIALAAAKQSRKSILTKINEPLSFEEFLMQNKKEQGFIAHCQKDDLGSLGSSFENIPNCSVSVLIGPEGDFSETEIELAISKNYKEVSLGKSRLRTETAALVACMTLHLKDK
jgi:16S rRNA (uracil1498-N3)-methyltransferase